MTTNITTKVPSAGPAAEEPDLLRQLLGLRPPGVVAVEQHAGGDHHRRTPAPTPRSAGTGAARPVAKDPNGITCE